MNAHKILFPTDFSPASQEALRVAGDLAQRLGARLDVVHAVTLRDNPVDPDAVDWDERLALDVWYVDNNSLRLDVRIILLTIKLVLTGGGGISADGHATMPEFTGEP